MNIETWILQVKLLVTDVADVDLPLAEAVGVVGQVLPQGLHRVEVHF